MSDDETWKEFFERWALGIVEFAAKNPKDFIIYCKYQNGEVELVDGDANRNDYICHHLPSWSLSWAQILKALFFEPPTEV